MSRRIIDHLLEIEGWPVYTDSPADRGGPTKGGITLSTLRAWRGTTVTVADLKALQQPEAERIYQRLFIEAPRFDKIVDELLRFQLVDSGVLSGPERATTWLQTAAGVIADGALGPKTLAVVNVSSAHWLALRVAAARIRFLGRLIERERVQAVYAAGWMARATTFLDLEAERAQSSS